jgi:hypothetical protein
MTTTTTGVISSCGHPPTALGFFFLQLNCANVTAAFRCFVGYAGGLNVVEVVANVENVTAVADSWLPSVQKVCSWSGKTKTKACRYKNDFLAQRAPQLRLTAPQRHLALTGRPLVWRWLLPSQFCLRTPCQTQSKTDSCSNVHHVQIAENARTYEIR